MNSTVTRCFCMNQVLRGSPLSFTGNYEHGFPVVREYDGKAFCGISNQVVVNIDSMIRHGTTNPLYVAEGGLIDVVRLGNVFISHELFTNYDKADYNKYIRPTKKGLFKIQKKRAEKSVGMIKLLLDRRLEVTLF